MNHIDPKAENNSTAQRTPSDAPNNQAPNTEKTNREKDAILNMQEWIDLDLSDTEADVVIGSPTNPLIRPKTKNLIEAPEKSYKTTVLLRLMAGLACGKTVFPALPVMRARKVLYLHGELSNAEIRARTIGASSELSGPYTNFLQGRSLEAHLVNEDGQRILEELVRDYKPEDLVLDPWQSFISGCDENSFKEMSRATKFCDKLINEYGVTLWIPIHLGKVHKRGARGHSTIAGWRDTRIQLTRESNGVRVTVDPRWAQPPNPFRLRFGGGTMWADGESSYAGHTAKIRTIVETSGGAVHRSDIAKLLATSDEAVRKAIERAEAAGAVDREGDFVILPKKPDSAPIIN